jgi:hypothetical protein
MMEGLAALSLACNVIQIVSACKDAVELYSIISKRGSLDIDLSQNAARIKVLSTRLMSLSNSQPDVGSQSQSEFLQLARECLSTAQKVQGIIEDINRGKGSLGKFMKTMRRKAALVNLDKSLQRQQQTLQTGLLHDIW